MSVIVTTDGRSGTLRVCMEALCHQTQPAADFEAIVVAVGAADVAHAALSTLATPYAMRVIRRRDDNPAAARNHGAAAAAGRWCLFLDDDAIADPALLAAHLRVLRTREVIGLGHLVITPATHGDGFGRYHAQRWNDRQTRLDEGERPSFMDCYGNNMSVSRTAFLDAGGFAVDVPHAYDRELGYRLVQQGATLVSIPDAVARKEERGGFQELTTEVERTGAADIALYRRHPSTLPHLELGRFTDVRHRVTLLRRFLLAMDLPLRPLAIAGLLLGRRSWSSEWCRFLRGYCYWRGVRHAVHDTDMWRRLIHGPVILMYHAFGEPHERPSCYVIPGRRFAWHMAWLKWRRYPVLSLEDFLRHRHEFRLPPARAVIITVDDGYADNRTVAYPIMRRYNIPATIFPVSSFVGDRNRWDSDGELAGRPLLSWSEMREMLQGGIHFGVHTRRHLPLTTLSPREVWDEIGGAKEEMERALVRPILSLSYPHGRFDAVSEEMAEQAGILGACCSYPGVNDPVVPPYALRRIEVRGTDSFAHFVVALQFGLPGVIPRSWRRHTSRRDAATDSGKAQATREARRWGWT